MIYLNLILSVLTFALVLSNIRTKRILKKAQKAFYESAEERNSLLLAYQKENSELVEGCNAYRELIFLLAQEIKKNLSPVLREYVIDTVIRDSMKEIEERMKNVPSE